MSYPRFAAQKIITRLCSYSLSAAVFSCFSQQYQESRTRNNLPSFLFFKAALQLHTPRLPYRGQRGLQSAAKRRAVIIVDAIPLQIFVQYQLKSLPTLYHRSSFPSPNPNPSLLSHPLIFRFSSSSFFPSNRHFLRSRLRFALSRFRSLLTSPLRSLSFSAARTCFCYLIAAIYRVRRQLTIWRRSRQMKLMRMGWDWHSLSKRDVRWAGVGLQPGRADLAFHRGQCDNMFIIWRVGQLAKTRLSCLFSHLLEISGWNQPAHNIFYPLFAPPDALNPETPTSAFLRPSSLCLDKLAYSSVIDHVAFAFLLLHRVFRDVDEQAELVLEDAALGFLLEVAAAAVVGEVMGHLLHVPEGEEFAPHRTQRTETDHPVVHAFVGQVFIGLLREEVFLLNGKGRFLGWQVGSLLLFRLILLIFQKSSHLGDDERLPFLDPDAVDHPESSMPVRQSHG